MAHDHIFFKAAQAIDLAECRRFGQHTRGILERSRGNKAVSLERGLGDTEQHRCGFRGLAALLDNAFVFRFEIESIDLISPQQFRIAWIGDFHFPQHLAHDDLDVLVVNFDPLQAIDFLHFVDQVLLQILRSADLEDFVGHDWTFRQLRALFHEVAFKNNDVLGQRNKVLFFAASFRIFQDKLPFAANGAAHFDNAVDLRDLGRIFRTTRFEQFGHPRQTAGDILGLRHFSRRLRQQCSSANFLFRFDDDVGTGWNGIAGHDFTAISHDHNLRM